MHVPRPDVDRHRDTPPLGLRRLIALGASGGPIPFPEALEVLNVAVAVQRQLFGMAMMVSFSVGFASVLVAIGILLVRGRRALDRFSNIPDMITTKWLPVFSAAVVSFLGLYDSLRPGRLSRHPLHGSKTARCYRPKRRSRRLFDTTKTLENAIAAPAMSGFR